MSNLPKIPSVTEEMVENNYEKLLAATTDANILTAITLERHGGPCPLCKTEFRKKTINNDRGGFSWYEPACRCFPRCRRVRYPFGMSAPGCGRFLIAEKLMGIDYCTTCGDYREKPRARRASSGPITKRSSDGEGGTDA